MSEMYPEPSIFGPDGPPDSLIEEGRRVAATDFATRLHEARIRAGHRAMVDDENVVATAKRLVAYIRDGQ